jgi:hypothetical protein
LYHAAWGEGDASLFNSRGEGHPARRRLFRPVYVMGGGGRENLKTEGIGRVCAQTFG